MKQTNHDTKKKSHEHRAGLPKGWKKDPKLDATDAKLLDRFASEGPKKWTFLLKTFGIRKQDKETAGPFDARDKLLVFLKDRCNGDIDTANKKWKGLIAKKRRNDTRGKKKMQTKQTNHDTKKKSHEHRAGLPK